MFTDPIVVPSLIGGTVNAVVLVLIAYLLSRFWRDGVGRGLLVIFLFAAGGAYLGFAIGAGASPAWAALELVQVIVIGILALLGYTGSPYWLALGWAVHPLWDVGLHYIGPGRPFTPAVWAISCITFDLVVAAYVVLAYTTGMRQKLRLEPASPG